VLKLLLPILIVALAVWLLRSRYAFRLDFRDGRVTKRRGEVAPGLRRDLEDIAAHSGLSGSVRVYAGGVVKFSAGIGDDDRQRFRNVLGSRPGPGL
jgi:hypothetical protein